MSAADNAEQAREIVRRLLRVISREAPMADAAELLDENLISYMDGKEIARGRGVWLRWVRFLQHSADKKMRGLAIEIERMEGADGVVSVFARWRGERGGETKRSEIGVVQYEVRNGKIARIRTHKKNYVFIYGAASAFAPGFYWVLLRLLLHRPR